MVGKWGGIVAAAVLALAASPAHAETHTSIVLYSDPGDFIGQGNHRVVHPGNGTIDASRSTREHIRIDTTGGSHAIGDGVSLNFHPRRGYAFTTGFYDRATRSREGANPGIAISLHPRACNETFGRFEIKDIGYDAAGALRRLWLVFEQHCEGGGPALFGEVRLAVPVPDGSGTATPSIVRWPETDLGVATSAVPVSFLARSSTAITGRSIVGDNPGDFAVTADGCSGMTIAAGARCSVTVRFLPTAAGTRTALLRLTTTAGQHDVALQAFSFGGVTRAVIRSDSGDPVGQGTSVSHSLPSSYVGAGGTRQGAEFAIVGSNGIWWRAKFQPDDGGILAPGRYTGALRFPAPGTGPSIEVSRDSRSCDLLQGEFTVHEATFGDDGWLDTLALDFVQTCSGASGSLRGTLEFRRGDRTPPAPWMPGTSAGTPVAEQVSYPDETVVTLFSDGEFIGQGWKRVFRRGNSAIDASDSRSTRTVVRVEGGTFGEYFDLTFQAPRGYSFTEGVFDSRVGDPQLDGARPEVYISGEHRACGGSSWSRYEVKDLAYDAAGELSRVWIAFEFHCSGTHQALFGEVRIGMPPRGTAAPTVMPELLRWPEADLGRDATAVPVSLRARAPLQVGAAAVAGSHQGDFQVADDGCAGRTIATGHTCEVWVRFTPQAAGTRTAVLRITESSGAVHEVPLEGYAWGGSTRFVMESEPGEWVGEGKRWAYDVGSDYIVPTRNWLFRADYIPWEVNGVDGLEGADWNGDFESGDGTPFEPRGYFGATEWPGEASEPSMDVFGNGRACGELTGEFNVTEATFHSDGRPRTLGLDFVQVCEGSTLELRGSFEYRKGHTAALAPWMTTRSLGAVPREPGTQAPPYGDYNPGGSSPPPPPADSSPADSEPPPASDSAQEPVTSAEPTYQPFPEPSDATIAPNSPPTVGCGGRTYLASRVVRGTGRADRLLGGRRGDVIHGRGGRDRIFARRGNDCVVGGPGRDLIDCGRGGRDIAKASRGDRVRNCERVIRVRSGSA